MELLLVEVVLVQVHSSLNEVVLIEIHGSLVEEVKGHSLVEMYSSLVKAVEIQISL